MVTTRRMRYLLSVGGYSVGGVDSTFSKFPAPRLADAKTRYVHAQRVSLITFDAYSLRRSLPDTRQLQEREVCRMYVSILTASTLWWVISGVGQH